MREDDYLVATDLAKLRIAKTILDDTWLLINMEPPQRVPMMRFIMDEIARLEQRIEEEHDAEEDG